MPYVRGLYEKGDRMRKLIDGQEALDALEKLFPPYPLEHELMKGVACGVALAKVCIKHLPEAKIERLTAEWRKREKFELFYCSACGKNVQHISGYYYCPSCGAYMWRWFDE